MVRGSRATRGCRGRSEDGRDDWGYKGGLVTQCDHDIPTEHNEAPYNPSNDRPLSPLPLLTGDMSSFSATTFIQSYKLYNNR